MKADFVTFIEKISVIDMIIIIRVSRFQFGSNWESLTVITVDLSSRVTFLQAVRQELTFAFFA